MPKLMSLCNWSGLLDGPGSPKSTLQEYGISTGEINGFWNLGLVESLSSFVAPSSDRDSESGASILSAERRRNRLHLAISAEPAGLRI